MKASVARGSVGDGLLQDVEVPPGREVEFGCRV